MSTSAVRSKRATAAPRYRVVRARAPNAFPWTPELIELLGKHSDRAVAKRAGISVATVAAERRRRGIEPFQTKRSPVHWTPEMISALGTDSDANAMLRRVLESLDIVFAASGAFSATRLTTHLGTI